MSSKKNDGVDKTVLKQSKQGKQKHSNTSEGKSRNILKRSDRKKTNTNLESDSYENKYIRSIY